ncbi:MAG TPA: SIMPL domain-containing protein [Candidatus Baltobacteraceae bacterium]|nr:SIMPL domain-containing protein [Candidatus Baltobacteraceae bacterium]
MTRLLAAIALAVSVCAPAAAAQFSEITVTAEGRSTAMPDMATASFAISTYASTAASATSDNNERYGRLLDSLRALGIKESDIRTTSFNVSYNPPPQPPAMPDQGVRYGYTVSRGIDVTVRRLSLVGKVIDTAVSAGVTDVNGVAFDNSDSRRQYAQALQDGVQQARAQAQAMAAAAGLRIVRVKSMQVGGPNRITPVVEGPVFRAAAAPVPTQIQPNSVEVTATVTVTYESQ